MINSDNIMDDIEHYYEIQMKMGSLATYSNIKM